MAWYKGIETKFVACVNCSKLYQIKNGTNALLKHLDKCTAETNKASELMPIPVEEKEKIKTICLGVVSHELRPFATFSGKAMQILMQQLIRIGAQYGHHQIKDVSFFVN